MASELPRNSDPGVGSRHRERTLTKTRKYMWSIVVFFADRKRARLGRCVTGVTMLAIYSEARPYNTMHHGIIHSL